MRKSLLVTTLILAVSLSAPSQQQPDAATPKLHWSDKIERDSCSVWFLYDGHERVAHVEQCPQDDPDYISRVSQLTWGVFDDLDAAKKRCEEVYKHRDQEKPEPKEKPARLSA